MIKKIIFVLSVLLIALPAFAKWDVLTSPTTENLNAVYFTTTSEGTIVGANGSVLRTSSGGTVFSLTTEGSANFNDVIFPTTSEGYILGDSGQLWKTTDGGATYNLMPVSIEVAGADFRKGAFNGNNRLFAAYDRGTGISYLYSSTDGGLNFTASLANSIASYEIRGVASTSTNNFIWGYDPANNNTILLNGATTVWSSGTQVISDIYLINSFIGYAVGSGGLILKTSNGGNSWTSLNSGVTTHLNAVNFISTNNGWVVGEGGTILFTTNEGASFTPYVDSTLEPSLWDVYALLEAPTATLQRPVVHAFIAGKNGKIYKLSSPTITTITPATAMQGWVGYVTVEGTGFMDKADVQFSGTQIQVVSTAFDSSTKLRSLTVVGTTAAVGARDLAVENMDKTFSNEVSSFTILSNTNEVTISNVWFGANKYQLPPFSILPTPNISFEVATTSSGIITKESVNAKVLFYKDGSYSNVYFLPAATITMESIDSKHANVSFSLPAVLPAGLATIELYAEDSLGNPARLPLYVQVASSDTSLGGALPPGADPLKGEYGSIIPKVVKWETTKSARIGLQVRVQGGVDLPYGFTLKCFNFVGTALLIKNYPDPVVNKKDIELAISDFPVSSLGAQTLLFLAIDNRTNLVFSRRTISVVPW